MADPLTLLGAASSIMGIIDILGESISIISKLRGQWQDADLAILTFETQLTALKTALNEIKKWTDTNFNDPHHQLVMDLDRCVACCQLLIGKINAEISQFQTASDDRLDATAKFKLLFKTKGIEDIQKMILLQTNALTLLLTACNNKTLSEHAKESNREFKVLLLGSKSKSDVMRCFEIAHSKGYSADELLDHRPMIFRNVVDSAKALITAILQLEITPETEANRTYVKFLAEYQPKLMEPISSLDPMFGEALGSVWRDPCILPLMERQAEFYLHESAEYFFDQVQRISSPYYFPNEMDVLRARIITTGIYETRIAKVKFNISMYDTSGQRFERQKWIHLFGGHRGDHVCHRPR